MTDAQGRKQRGGRRQQLIDNLLTACRAEVVELERGAARDLAASDRLVQLLRGGAAWGSSEPGSPVEDFDEEPLPLSEDGEEEARAGCDSEDALFVPDPLPFRSQEGELQDRRDSAEIAEIAQQLLQALASDNTVTECNVRDYEVALSATLDEIVRTRVEVVQMESVCGQIGQLQELLSREGEVHARLQEENAQLVERQHELLAVIQEAIEADGDEEDVALARSLRAENAALRKLLFSTGYTEPEIEYEPPPQEDPCAAIAALRERELAQAALQADHHLTNRPGPSSIADSGECLVAASADRPQEEPPALQGGPSDFHAALQEGLRRESLRRGEDGLEECQRRAPEPSQQTSRHESEAQDRVLEEEPPAAVFGGSQAHDRVLDEEPPALSAAQLDDMLETSEARELPAVVFSDSQAQTGATPDNGSHGVSRFGDVDKVVAGDSGECGVLGGPRDLHTGLASIESSQMDPSPAGVPDRPPTQLEPDDLAP